MGRAWTLVGGAQSLGGGAQSVSFSQNTEVRHRSVNNLIPSGNCRAQNLPQTRLQIWFGLKVIVCRRKVRRGELDLVLVLQSPGLVLLGSLVYQGVQDSDSGSLQ